MSDEVRVRRATLAAAQLMLALFKVEFEKWGWTPALYGSTVLVGSGRDVDVILVRTSPWGDAVSAIFVKEKLRTLMSDVTVTPSETDRGIYGVTGTLRGLAVDVTVVEAW